MGEFENSRLIRIRNKLQSGSTATASSTWTSSSGDEDVTDVSIWTSEGRWYARIETYLIKYREAADLWNKDELLSDNSIDGLLSQIKDCTGISVTDFVFI